MNDTNNTAVTFETLAELLPRSASPEVESVPSLRTVLKGLSPLPRAALFLGIADDRLPVLLNLADPVPGPVLVAGDSGEWKDSLPPDRC